MTSEPRSPPSLTSTSQTHLFSPEHRLDVQRSTLVSPAMYYPLYPSLTLHTYYPNPLLSHNFMHISSSPRHCSPALYGSIPIPSASQSHVPTIRGSLSPSSIRQLDSNIDSWASPYMQYTNSLLSPL
jgi:hypothetical protein